MEKRDKLDRIPTLDFSFRSKPFLGKYVLQVRDLSFAYDPDVPLISDLDFYVTSRDRLGVIGKNGKGKTTLLKLLAGILPPQKGEILYNQGVEKGFFEEGNIQSLVDTRTVEDELFSSSEDVDRQQARNICGTMMFEGDDALKKISVLSGGEKSRVLLGKILLKPFNLLLLDEPTNHLDMESCDALLAALDSYEGAVIFVTHNEMLLHAVAERLIVFENDEIRVFEGSYERFLESVGWKDEGVTQTLTRKSKSKDQNSLKATKKDLRRRRSEVITERARVLKPLEQGITKVENDIEAHEAELKRLTREMGEALQRQNGKRITELSQSVHHCHQMIDSLFHDLEKLTTTLEMEKERFREKLEPLEGEAP
jgi:ATP-binding cassette subfamily F protein 3